MGKNLDVRQSEFRGILQQLFPYVADQTLDILLQSINSDLTPPLKVDASNPVSLVVNVGPTVVYNPESNRQRSISFVNNIIPSLISGTVTFPAASGGTISTSTGQTYILTLPSGDYAQALLALDTSNNIVVKMGAASATLGGAVVPSPVTNTLPFAYVTIHNNAGTIANISQNAIFQFTSGGGGGGGGGGGVAQEVPLTIGTTSQVVTFPTPQSGTNYVVLAQVANITDSHPEYIPVTITNRTPTGFTASWNAPLDTSNYLLDYIVPPGISQEQVGEAVLSMGATTTTITIPIPLTSTTYVVVAELVNLTDITPQFQPVTITNKTNSTFTVTWNAPVDTANYRIAYQVASAQ